jgi:putative flippase GtrA
MHFFLRRIIRFLVVGGVGFSVDAATYHLLRDFGLVPETARLASLGWATAVTWLLNRRFTFGASERHAAEEGLRYLMVTCVAQGLNYVTFLTIIDLLPGLPHIAAIGCSAAIAAVFSFTGHHFFSFAPRAQVSSKKDTFDATI